MGPRAEIVKATVIQDGPSCSPLITVHHWFLFFGALFEEKERSTGDEQ
jgi:hypothetical protein